MTYLGEIVEKDSRDYCFEVRHKVLEIPRNIYLERLADYENPFCEEAAQELVEEYLDWKEDHGLIGMIRLDDDREEGIVRLDAAVRYIVLCEPSTPGKPSLARATE